MIWVHGPRESFLCNSRHRTGRQLKLFFSVLFCNKLYWQLWFGFAQSHLPFFDQSNCFFFVPHTSFLLIFQKTLRNYKDIISIEHILVYFFVGVKATIYHCQVNEVYTSSPIPIFIKNSRLVAPIVIALSFFAAFWISRPKECTCWTSGQFLLGRTVLWE